MSTHVHARDKLDYRTLCDLAFTKLKSDILGGQLEPGQKLDQTELAARFGISRMPVRDALRKLEAEGLVTLYPERGAFVAVLDLEEMREIYQIRESLHCLAVRMAVASITEEQVSALARIEEQMEEACRRQELAMWLQLDRQFHAGMFQPCGNRRLLKLISDYMNATQQFRRAYIAAPERMERAHATHRQMLQAVKAGDADWIARLASEHMRESVRAILEVHQAR